MHHPLTYADEHSRSTRANNSLMLHDVGCSKNCEGFFFISIALTVSAIIEQNSVYMTIVYNSSELGEKLNNVSNLHLEAGK